MSDVTDPLWLRPAACPLLQDNPERIDAQALRQLQRLLELGLSRPGCDELARASLEEIAATLRADQAAVVEATPALRVRWQHARHGPRLAADQLPQPTLT